MATKKKSNVLTGPDPDDKGVNEAIMADRNRPLSMYEQLEAARKKAASKGKK